MYDPYVTRELTIRDLLVHRSGLGLGAGDLLWWPPSTYDRKEIARRLRYIKPATSFRSAYAYDNVLYLVAGEVIETLSGQSWEDFVSTRILSKVGMTSSNVRHSAAAAGGNLASPHAQVDGKVRPIQPFDSDNTNPAGGINACAEDMAKWLKVLLNEGQLADGSRLFSAATWRQISTPVTPQPNGAPPPELPVAAFELPRLRARPRGPRFPGIPGADAHRRPSRLCVPRAARPRSEARRRGADQPGVGRDVQRNSLRRRRRLHRRAAEPVARRVPEDRRPQRGGVGPG